MFADCRYLLRLSTEAETSFWNQSSACRGAMLSSSFNFGTVSVLNVLENKMPRRGMDSSLMITTSSFLPSSRTTSAATGTSSSSGGTLKSRLNSALVRRMTGICTSRPTWVCKSTAPGMAMGGAVLV